MSHTNRGKRLTLREKLITAQNLARKSQGMARPFTTRVARAKLKQEQKKNEARRKPYHGTK